MRTDGTSAVLKVGVPGVGVPETGVLKGGVPEAGYWKAVGYWRAVGFGGYARRDGFSD